MESHEIMKRAITTVGVKSVASDMSLSASLIYKWCEPKDAPDAGGADNPLDRLARIYEITGDAGPISWLCEKADGFFVRNPEYRDTVPVPLLSATRQILREFSDLLDAVSASWENDGRIDSDEAVEIRKEWEHLKSSAETFVTACEKGVYRK